MKKFTITIAAIMIVFVAKAQITITGADMPQAGRINIVANDTLTNVNIGTASASPQTWDFSSLLNHYTKLANYSPTAPYQQNAAAFEGSNIYTWGPAYFFTSFFGGAPVDQSLWGYMYWKTDETGFHIVGFRGDLGTGYGYTNVLEQPQELLMGTPATYLSNFVDSARWVVKLDKNPSDLDTIYKSILKKELNVDAFGSMTTSFGTFQVIRVHEYVTEVDSIEGIYLGYTQPIIQLRDTLNNYQFWAKNINYPIAIVHADKNNNIKSVEYLIDTLPSFSVTGNVFKTNGVTKVQSGTASLIIKDSYNHLFNVLETVNIDNNGNCQFANVVGGNFLVLADPDPTQYPYLLPTYYGDTTYWEGASTLFVTQDINVNINCSNDSVLAGLIGPGIISGTIWADTTQTGGKSGPVNSTKARGVRVTLEQNPGGACRIATTGQNGTFNFDELPEASYKIKVDIAGLFMESTYYINVNADSLSHVDMDFVYDTTKISTYYNTGISDHNLNPQFDVNFYPNPFTSVANIHISNPNNDTRAINFKVYNLLGSLIKEITEENTENITFTNEGLSKGMYIYELRLNNALISTGKIVLN